MTKYSVVLDPEADEGLKNGSLEFAPGGVRDVKSKKMVRYFRHSEDDEAQARIILVRGSNSEALSKVENERMLAAINKNTELSWQAAIIGYRTFQMTYEGFASMASKMDDIRNDLNEQFLHNLKVDYKRNFMDLKSLYSALRRIDCPLNEYEISTVLNRVSSYLDGLLEEYEAGKIDSKIAVRVIEELTVAFQICADEASIYCLQKYGSFPVTRDDWSETINRVINSFKLREEHRKLAFFSSPGLQTAEIESLAAYSHKTVLNIRKETTWMIKQIGEGLTRDEYLNLPKTIEQQYLRGDCVVVE